MEWSLSKKNGAYTLWQGDDLLHEFPLIHTNLFSIHLVLSLISEQQGPPVTVSIPFIDDFLFEAVNNLRIDYWWGKHIFIGCFYKNLHQIVPNRGSSALYNVYSLSPVD